MQEDVTIHTVRIFRANDIKKILAEKYHTSVDNIKCEGYYSFSVTTDEKATNIPKEVFNKENKNTATADKH